MQIVPSECLLQTGRIRRHAYVQVGKLSQRVAILRAQPLEKARIAQPGLALGFTQIAQWDPLESTCRHASLSIL